MNLAVDISRTRAASGALLVSICLVLQPGGAAASPSSPAGQTPPSASRGRSSDATAPSFAAAKRVLEQARALVADAEARDIVLIDPELAADPAAVRRLDAFTVREEDGRLRPKVYINVESEIVQEAARGDDFYVSVLAAVIVHELAHLEGADEAEARQAERRFFEDLIVRGRVDRIHGKRYLALLRGQPNAGNSAHGAAR
jgi:hypothetical protein